MKGGRQWERQPNLENRREDDDSNSPDHSAQGPDHHGSRNRRVAFQESGSRFKPPDDETHVEPELRLARRHRKVRADVCDVHQRPAVGFNRTCEDGCDNPDDQ